MQFVVGDLIKAARVYKDDDHEDEDAWLTSESWLRLFNVEYALLYPRWVRAGLITPPFTESALTGTTTVLSNVLAIAGVARLESNRYTPLPHLQPSLGRTPWLDKTPNRSCGWLGYGPGDNLTVELSPPPSDAGSYVVRYIQRPAYFTALTDTVELPYGADERIVLGMADRAGIKDSTVSRNIKEMKADADAALAFLISGRGDGARVRRVTGSRARAPQNDRYTGITLGAFDPSFNWVFV